MRTAAEKTEFTAFITPEDILKTLVLLNVKPEPAYTVVCFIRDVRLRDDPPMDLREAAVWGDMYIDHVTQLFDKDAFDAEYTRNRRRRALCVDYPTYYVICWESWAATIQQALHLNPADILMVWNECQQYGLAPFQPA